MKILYAALRLLVKVVKWGIPLVVLLVAAWLGYLVYRVHHGLPDYDATVLSDSVNNDVRVVRDNWGVPHIFADCETDAYFALGYCMAQDRLFQMELLRRVARGEMAEALGPLATPIDRIMRAFRLRLKAEDFVADAQKHASPEMLAAAEAFLAGMNQFIMEEPLPWEFSALMIPCRPFTLVDCISVAAIMPITFADGLRTDPLKSMLKQKYPDYDVDLLFRGIEAAPVTIMESLEEAAAFQRERALADAVSPQISRGMESAAAWLDTMAAWTGIAGSHLGSNSWVLSGDKTASGRPILANDPHIAFTNPSVWYEAHMKYADYENYGYHLPPIPIPLLGHNEDRGWGLTMFANDDVDMYMEKINPDNPNQVMYKGQWVDCVIVREVIKVRFGADVTCDVRITPHGPIVNDLLELLLGYEGPPVALSWIWQHFDFTAVDAFYEMSHARDYDRFADAMKKLTSPGLNISYADAAGNIAWWAAGILPARPPHIDAKTLLEGWTGRDEIEEYLPFEATPHLKNPECGMIVTANNLPTIYPVGEPPLRQPLLQGYFKPGDRAGRIKELLLERDDWTIEDLRAVQLDDLGYATRNMAPVMARLAREEAARLEQIHLEALERVENWDYRHGVESVAATVFNHWADSLLIRIFGDEMTEKELRMYMGVDDSWIALQDMLADSESHWWDDITTPEKESAAYITACALQQACAALEKKYGGNVDGWRWGKAHTLTGKHPFGYLPGLGRLLNIGPHEVGGASQNVNNMLSKTPHDYSVIAGPSTRRLIDFAKPDQSLTILPTGNSGHLRSKYYDDQAEMFARGEYRPALCGMKDIEAAKAHEMRIRRR
ncbi:MAG TPA: penicillin acylase family protein [Candidatus Hydrogenedentes bacterium]|nr:penicillin acylase family protein [Candidatus Hydrogenedentota bacterium]